MKKALLVLVLLVSSHQLFAFVTQGHWRWRKDDGNETSATWLTTTEDAAVTITSSTDNIRLRMEFFNNNSDNSDLNTSVLVYSADGGETWDSVTTYAGDKAFVLAGSSPYVSDNEVTTQQLSGQTGYTFLPGFIVTATDTLGPNSIAPSEVTEYEWVIKPTPNILPNTNYLFKGDTAPGDGNYDGDIPPASLITAAVLPIHLENFKVQPDNNRVKIMWTTTSELNNDRFVIERSVDVINWKTVATIKGNGTSSIAHNYQALDINPVKGMNYYRIKQYDINGKANVSEIRSLRMLPVKTQIIVFPNPSKKNINFSLQNNLSDVAVTLTNSNGKMVHKEIMSNIQSNTNYSLKLNQQPAPGMYILRLEAKGFSESVKVVVQ